MELWLFLFGVLFLYFVFRLQKSSPKQQSQKYVDGGHKNRGERTQPGINQVLADYDEKRSLATFSISYGYQEEESKNNKPAKWLKTGEIINVKGLQIAGGMFYFGGKLPSLDGYGSEASLVDDALKTVIQPITYEDDSLGYWPKYISISEHCRGAYLNWLASNRDNPETPLGYIFIYFYGLERRIVVDSLQDDVEDSEYKAIFDELLRLIEIYGNSNSFMNYAVRLLEIMCLLRPSVVSHSEIENNPKHDSILFKYRLAKIVKVGKPIPADLALAWLKFNPDYNLKKPAIRCSQEFSEMFTHLYTNKYGDGIIIRPNKTRLNLEYYPASSSLRGVTISQEDLPDPSNLKGPIKKLISIAEDCSIALDSYSRYLGKENTSRSDISAILLLPEELKNVGVIHGLNKFEKWAEESISKHGGLVDFSEFWEFTLLPLPSKVNNKESDLIQLFSEKAGFGLVPDRRYHMTKPHVDGKLVLFRGGHGRDFEPSKEFNEMGIILRLGAMVATINSNIDQAQISLLKQLINQDKNLSSIEKLSLQSYLIWRINTPSNVTGLKALLQNYRFNKKVAVSRILVSVALADGKIDPAEIIMLEKLYAILDLDKSLVTSDIHSMTIGKASTRSKAKPSDPIKVPSEYFHLNEKELAIYESHTKDVQSMLNAIFVDEEPNLETSTDEADLEEIGIDPLHYSLYEQLVNKDRWTLEELDELCKKMGLMISGAIETINEWSFEWVDAPVLEEEADAVYIDRDIVEELEKINYG